MSALRPFIATALNATGSSTAFVGGATATVCVIKLWSELWEGKATPSSQLPRLAAWYTLMNVALTPLLYFLEPTSVREHARYKVYPRWGTANSAVTHLGVHALCTIMIIRRLFFPSSGEQLIPVEGDSMVYAAEMHIIAGAVATTTRDFIGFEMDWMFWMHHFVAFLMCGAVWIFADPDIWVRAALVGGLMEIGSFGYDLFFFVTDPGNIVTRAYQAIMLTSHVFVVAGVLAMALDARVRSWPAYWALSPAMVFFAYMRQGASSSIIAEEQKRQLEAKAQ